MEAKKLKVETERHIFIITGASKGYGQAIASLFGLDDETYNPFLHKTVDLILIGRDVKGLEETKKLVKDKASTTLAVIDLGDLSKLENEINKLLDQIIQQYRGQTEMKLYYYLINNAGSLGDLNDSSNFNLVSVQLNMDLNVTSMLFLTSRVLHQLESHATGLIIVNISSLAAIQPFECWGIYCVNKAARDMFIRVIAEENKNKPKIKALNYAPGPMDTNMQEVIRQTCGSEALRQVFIDMHKNGKLVNPRSSGTKLLRLLQENKFQSGAHIDYYD